MSAVESDRAAEIATLIARHHQYAVHKDSDCHWAISERWSYGEHAGWWVEHEGYLYEALPDGEDGPLPSRGEAEIVLIDHLQKAIAEAEAPLSH